MKIGIMGVGIVGEATAKVFEKIHEIYLYDKFKPDYNSKENLKNLVLKSEIIFICVPTPMRITGEIDYSSVHNSINQLMEEITFLGRNPEDILVVIRSTAVSGTTDKLSEKYPFRFAFNPVAESYELICPNLEI